MSADNWTIKSYIPDYEHDGDIDSWEEYLKEQMKENDIDPSKFKYGSIIQAAERDYDEEDEDGYETEEGWVTISGEGEDLKQRVLKVIN